MTKPITREEFCELAVLLYEKVTETAAAPVSPNPFTDTTNSQILKAYALGITTGTSTTTFSPNTLINGSNAPQCCSEQSRPSRRR